MIKIENVLFSISLSEIKNLSLLLSFYEISFKLEYSTLINKYDEISGKFEESIIKTQFGKFLRTLQYNYILFKERIHLQSQHKRNF